MPSIVVHYVQKEKKNGKTPLLVACPELGSKIHVLAPH